MMLTKHTSHIKSETLSKNGLKPWIASEIISNNENRQHYFVLYCQNKITIKNVILIFEMFSLFKLDNQKGIIMNINSMQPKTI